MPVILLLIAGFFFFAYGQNPTDSVIVFFKENKKVSLKGLSVKEVVKNRALVKIPEGEDINSFIQTLKKDPAVAYVIPNYRIKALAIPNDTYYNYQWYLPKIGAEQAWDLSTGSQDIYVAVLDTGIDYDHPDIRDNLWINQGELVGADGNGNGLDDGCEDGVDNDGNGYTDDCYGFNAIDDKGSAKDDNGHGTHVAGILGAIGNNGYGVAGVNWQVKVVACKFLDSAGYGDLNGLLKCLDYIESVEQNKGIVISVVNASYGYVGEQTELTVDCNTNPEAEKCRIASLRAIFVAAAGNGGVDGYGDNNDSQAFLPCNYSTVLDNVICVGATDNEDKKTSYSNYGFDTVNLFAPGGSSQEPCADYGMVNLSIYSDDGDDENDFMCAMGTSSAAPVVAGGIALLRSYLSTLTTDELINRILTTGDNILSLSGYSVTCNRINLYNALAGNTSPKICFDKPFSNGSYAYDLGSVEPGKENKFSLTIRSTGGEDLQLSNIYMEKGIQFTLSSDNCSDTTMSFLQECTLEITLFSLTSGEYTDTLHITTNTDYGQIDIQLSVKFNNPPVINSFSAQPSEGTVPLTVSFIFSVEDPDGDSLTCYLDVNGDKINDYKIEDCNGTEEIRHTYLHANNFEVMLTVEDPSGATTSSTTTVSAYIATSSDSGGGGGCSFNRNADLFTYLIVFGLFFATRSFLRRRFI